MRCESPVLISACFEILSSDVIFHATVQTGPKFSEKETLLFKNCLLAAADELIAAEKHLNELDSLTGDGDCGSTLKRLADGEKCLNYKSLLFINLEGVWLVH